jgi:hypothetical protein
MQLTDQSVSISITAVRRANRALLFVACLPLLIAVAVAAVGRISDRVSQHALDAQRIGAMTRRQALLRAEGLCRLISPDSPAEAVSAFGYSNGRQPGVFPRHDEWQVYCRSAAGRYFLRIDADSGEPLVIRREAGAPEADIAPANGDYRGGISHQEAARWAHYYLRLVGLPRPNGTPVLRYGGYDFTYRLDAPKGPVRTLRVRINPKDGSLIHLQNVIFRKFAPVSLAVAAAEEATSPNR